MSVFYGFATSDRDPSGGSPRPGCLNPLGWKHPPGRSTRPFRNFLVSRIGPPGRNNTELAMATESRASMPSTRPLRIGPLLWMTLPQMAN